MNGLRKPQQRDPATSRREGGNVIVLVAIALALLLAFSALAIDGGFIHHGNAQLQEAADAAALAALGELRNGGSVSTATAVGVAEQRKVGGELLRVASSNVEYGTYDVATQSFSAGTGGPGVAAFRAVARRSAGSQAGPLQLFLGKAVGVDAADAESSAVAAIRRRDVLILQDATLSFADEFADAIEADLDLIASMNGSMALPGDRVGVVRFARQAFEHVGLTDLASGAQQVVGAVDDMQVCQNASGSSGCDGTGTAAGIDLGRQIFTRDSTGDDSEKVLVIVTDGVPCHYRSDTSSDQWIAEGKAAAVAAADAAEAEGINIFTVTLAIDSGEGGCYKPQPDFNNSLARGFGVGLDTPNPKDLDDLLVSILRQMPVRLVQ